MRSRTEHRNHRSSGRRIAALIALLVGLVGYGPAPVTAQQWLPAGQMVGPLMWQFPLSLPDGTHLIGLRWVHERNNDSLYWFDIRSFMIEPRMYERQTPGFKSIRDVGDYDSDGLIDFFGDRFEGGPVYLFAPLTEQQELRPPIAGQLGVQTQSETRYLGDLDGDELNDFISTPNNRYDAARIVYGDREHPFQGPSYVDLPDLRDPLYPDLEPTYVAVVGLLGEKPCLVRLVTERPDWIYYELLELNQEDLQARAPTIRTTSLAKFFPSQPRYGAVVLRTPDVWWLFDGGGKHTSGMKITRDEITVMPVPEYWHGYWTQYFGQGGVSVDYNFPRVIDGERSFLKERTTKTIVDGVGEIEHSVFLSNRLIDPQTAEVADIGVAFPVLDQRLEAYATRMVVVPDIDGDMMSDFMVTISFKDTQSQSYLNSVSLYATSQRPTVYVPEGGRADTTVIAVVDEGVHWRLLAAAECSTMLPEALGLYDVSGAQIAQLRPVAEGPDILLVKPAGLPPVALWARLGTCSFRLQ